MPGEYEHRARARKAAAIAEVLIAHGADAQMADAVRRDPEARANAERLSGVRIPVSDLTWLAVVDIVRGRDKVRAR